MLCVLALVFGAIYASPFGDLVNGLKGHHPFGYPSYNETQAMLAHITDTNPLFTRKFIIGLSYECRLMHAYWLSAVGIHNRTNVRDRLDSFQSALLVNICREEGEGGVLKRCSHHPEIQNLLEQCKNQPESSSDKYFPDDRWGRTIITSLHHAREPSSLTATLHIFIALAEGLSRWFSDLVKPEAQLGIQKTPLAIVPHVLAPALMTSRELLYVDMINPDGYVAIERTGDTRIRKNQRPTCTRAGYKKDPLASGVDLNRNYDSNFRQDHGNCDPEEYEGTHPFSEPETRSIRRLGLTFKPHLVLNFHAYGDIWTRPWNCCPNKKLEKRHQDIFDEIEITLNVPAFGSAPELEQLGYPASGEADDWFMDAIGAISMSPEVGPEYGGFYPNSSEVTKLNKENTERALAVIGKTSYELTLNWDSSVKQFFIFNSGLKGTGPITILSTPLKMGGGGTEGEYLNRGFYSSGHMEQYSNEEFTIYGVPHVLESEGIESRGKLYLEETWEKTRICLIPNYSAGNKALRKAQCTCATGREEDNRPRPFQVAKFLSYCDSGE